jgi:hypothetical protein
MYVCIMYVLYMYYVYIQDVPARGIQKYKIFKQDLEYRLDIGRATTGAHIAVYGRA